MNLQGTEIIVDATGMGRYGADSHPLFSKLCTTSSQTTPISTIDSDEKFESYQPQDLPCGLDPIQLAPREQ